MTREMSMSNDTTLGYLGCLVTLDTQSSCLGGGVDGPWPLTKEGGWDGVVVPYEVVDGIGEGAGEGNPSMGLQWTCL